MKNSEVAWLNMVRTVMSTCDEFNSTWSADTNFSETKNDIESKITEIEAQKIIQEEDTTGFSEQKIIYRDDLITKTRFVAVRVVSYATVTGNKPLLNSCKIADSKYQLMSSDKLYSFSMLVHSKAEENKTALASYGITTAILEALETAASTFHDYIEAPALARQIKSDATKKIKTLIKETNQLLKKRLDIFAKIYETAAPDFYSRYLISRKIQDSPSSILALRGTVVDSVSNEPLANVNVHISGTSVERITGETGVFEVLNLAEGNYDIMLERPEYLPLTYSVTIVNNQTADVTIPLVHV